MEKRIFKFGESSAAVILPKKWMEKNGLKASDVIYLSEDQAGGLVMAAKESPRQDVEKVIDRRTSSNFINRLIGINYMYGTYKLRIYSQEGFTRSQLDSIEQRISYDCPGFEITNQSDKDVIIEDLTNIKEVNMDKIMLRLRSLINEEFKEMTKGDPKTIPKVERLVNRFFMLGIRYINVTQARDAMKFSSVLQDMETISDRMYILSSKQGVRKFDVFEDLSKQFELSLKGFAGDLDAVEKVSDIRASLISKLDKSDIDKLSAYMIKDIANNISNISEFGLRTEGSNPLG